MAIDAVAGPHSDVGTGKVAVGQRYLLPPPEVSLCSCPQLLIMAQHALRDCRAASATTGLTNQETASCLFTEMEHCLQQRGKELEQRQETKKKQNEQHQQQQKQKKKRPPRVNKQLPDSNNVILTFRDALSAMLPFAHPALIVHALLKTIETKKEEVNEAESKSKIENHVINFDDEKLKIEQLQVISLAAVECLKVVS